MSDRLDRRRDFKAAEICATKDVACIRWGWNKAYVDRNGGVQSDPMGFDSAAERGLLDQNVGTLSGRLIILRRLIQQPMGRAENMVFSHPNVAHRPH